MCFISRILLAKTCKVSSMRLDILKDCIKLKLVTFLVGPVKPYSYSVASMEGSTFSLLLDADTKVVTFASQPQADRLCHMESGA